MPQPEAKPNPLAAQRKPQQPQMHPMKAHAMIWRHVGTMDSDTLTAKSAQTDKLLPILGALAGNPKVTGKDVIKAASQAAADGIATPTEAVQFISAMPEKPEDLQGWLRNIYAANLSAAVHMKAAQMKAGQPVAGAPVPPPAVPSAPPGTSEAA